MKTLVYDAAKKLDVKPERIFGLALDWYEIRRVRRIKVVKIYRDWKYKQKNNQLIEDFALDILAGRTETNENNSDGLVLSEG